MGQLSCGNQKTQSYVQVISIVYVALRSHFNVYKW